MSTLDTASHIWRQVKRSLSAVLFAGGIYLLWLLYTGDLNGHVMMFFAALLTGGGVIGMLFPAKIRFLGGSGDDAY